MNILSDRILSLEESQTIAMARKSRELIDSGIDVISLSLGEPDFNTPDFIKISWVSWVGGLFEINHWISNPVDYVFGTSTQLCNKHHQNIALKELFLLFCSMIFNKTQYL